MPTSRNVASRLLHFDAGSHQTGWTSVDVLTPGRPLDSVGKVELQATPGTTLHVLKRTKLWQLLI